VVYDPPVTSVCYWSCWACGGIANSRAHESAQEVMVDVECRLPYAEVQVFAAEYPRLFGDDVRFGRLHNRMVLETRWLDVPLPNHHALALGLLEMESARLHRKMDLIQAVERAISRDLQGSQLGKVASDLNVSGRTLRRRLTDHGLTFEALLEQVRRARCMGLLGNPGLSIERITQEVGYSDVRSFRRAFKRWTGLSPSAFRGMATDLH